MEVVKNGELLEAQVADDARAKARRLLEAADRECQLLRSEGEKRLQEDLRRVDEGRDQRLAMLRREMDSSLPLDYRRTRLAFLEQALEKALAAYFAGLSAADARRVLGHQLRRAAGAFSGRHVVVRHAGLDGPEARRIMAESLPDVVVDRTLEMDAQEAAGAVKGLLVECSDGSRRCRATYQELSLHLLDEHREELVNALFGEDALAAGAERRASS